MQYLIDTHVFLWMIADDPQLSAFGKKIIESDADLLISIASIWEIAVKNNIGKLFLAEPFETFIPQQLACNRIEILPIRLQQLNLLITLPLQHRDPFDRLLICQAIAEQIPILSADEAFDRYSVERIWQNP
jgi:PIN domain nuclease of toxin-antitoxin system